MEDKSKFTECESTERSGSPNKRLNSCPSSNSIIKMWDLPEGSLDPMKLSTDVTHCDRFYRMTCTDVICVLDYYYVFLTRSVEASKRCVLSGSEQNRIYYFDY